MVLGLWLIEKTEMGQKVREKIKTVNANNSYPFSSPQLEEKINTENVKKAQPRKTNTTIYLRNKAQHDYMKMRHANALKQMGLPDISSPLPRRPMQKEPLRNPPGVQHRILVKFHDRSFARASKDGKLVISGQQINPKLFGVIQEYGIHFSPNHTASEDLLVTLETQALASTKEEPADLGGMLIASTSSSDPKIVWAAANALHALDDVEFVSLSSMDSPPPPPGPADIPPTSSLLSASQTYRGTNGINADDAWSRFGVKGQGVRITDCEYFFNSMHEDLADLVMPQPGSIQYYTDFGDDHGTAVLGILTAAENNYGMTGIIPMASSYFYPEYATVNGNFQSRSACIAAALTASARGDVVLLEMQEYGFGWTTENGRFVPAEYDQAVWLVVKTGTDAGKHVVAAAGNGGQNRGEDLDSANYATYRNRGDSGAIIVGAGSTNRARYDFSTFGSRVNLQGWGGSVATLGYGDYITYGNDPNQKYTRTFSGTSSASPIVASSVVLVESYVRQRLGRPLTPIEMRQVLVVNGKAQTGDLSRKIGPLPDLSATLTSLAAQVITWTNPAAITYGTTLTATQLNASSSVAGTFAYNPALGSTLNAGTNTLTAVFTASNPTNYVSPLTNTVSLVVNPASLFDLTTWLEGETMSAALLIKLAIGGASSAKANDGEIPLVTLDSTRLSLSAIVRTGGPAGLSVTGEAGSSLTNWSSNGITVTISTNTNKVPMGHQRRVFSIDLSNSPTRQFLRLKATMP